MKNLKRVYTFAFCVIYKSIDKLKYAFWSDWKTLLVMCMAEAYLIIGVMAVYEAFTKGNFMIHFLGSKGWLIATVLLLIKIPIFIIHDKWKDYMIEFDNLPQPEKKKWTIGTWGTIALILVFLVITFYCYSLVDWEGRNNIPIRQVQKNITDY